VVNRNVFSDKAEDEVFSFEKDFLEKKVSEQSLYAIVSDGFFIDIGVPEDYAIAQEILLKQLN
jgi:D-glycero-alpha-D-manno-heptose 1-phosphate guanylyltransferase